MKYLLLVLLLFSQIAWAQFPGTELDEDLEVGGDIFTDFNEDLEASQVMEDERFYRYSRFFSVSLGLGATTFTGNRGIAYSDNHPSFSFALMYFIDFQNVFTMGFEYSRHTMFIDTYVNGSRDQIIGAIQTNMLRPFFGFRYYVDTSDLGTAITYSNPYFAGRIEYWYQTNTYPENNNLSDEEGGGIGTAVGFGLEFPVELKKSYYNFEFLYHTVNFYDKYTMDYRKIPDSEISDEDRAAGKTSKYGYDDLSGNVMSFFASYNISW